MNHMRRYHTLLEKEGGVWVIAFGDYNKSLVHAERDELWYSYQIDMIGKPRKGRLKKDELLKIITTADNQVSINKAVASENFLLKVQAPVEGV